MEELKVEEVLQNNNESNLKAKKTNVIVIVLSCILIPVIAVIAVLVGVLSADENLPQYHKLNEKIVFENLEFTFLEYKAKDYYVNPITANTTYPDNENNLLCSISLKLYNPTNSKINLTDSVFLSSNHRFMFHLLCDGVEYNTSYSYSDAYLMAHDEIDARETIDCDLLYEVPKELFNNAKTIELKFSLNKTDADEIHIVKLKSE